jgi:ATP-dependent Clp protease ATP-binding subunit ClpC
MPDLSLGYQSFPLTPRMQRTMDRAAAISAEHGQTFVGTEHVLLALLEDRDGVAGLVLHHLGVADAVRLEVLRVMASDGYRSPKDPAP